MEKQKIAISVSTDVLKMVDAGIDGSRVRSRSQAIELLIKKGIGQLDTALILVSRRHHALALHSFGQSTVIESQIAFLRANGISRIVILTQPDGGTLARAVSGKAAVHEADRKYNGEALYSLRNDVAHDFVVMSGDTFCTFNVRDMMDKHVQRGTLATMGLITHGRPSSYGSAVLDGDFVTEFTEKPKVAKTHLINAGIYIFKPAVFGQMAAVKSLERDLFPRLARMKQLAGYCISGEYVHLSETLAS